MTWIKIIPKGLVIHSLAPGPFTDKEDSDSRKGNVNFTVMSQSCNRVCIDHSICRFNASFIFLTKHFSLNLYISENKACVSDLFTSWCFLCTLLQFFFFSNITSPLLNVKLSCTLFPFQALFFFSLLYK